MGSLHHSRTARGPPRGPNPPLQAATVAVGVVREIERDIDEPSLANGAASPEALAGCRRAIPRTPIPPRRGPPRDDQARRHRPPVDVVPRHPRRGWWPAAGRPRPRRAAVPRAPRTGAPAGSSGQGPWRPCAPRLHGADLGTHRNRTGKSSLSRARPHRRRRRQHRAFCELLSHKTGPSSPSAARTANSDRRASEHTSSSTRWRRRSSRRVPLPQTGPVAHDARRRRRTHGTAAHAAGSRVRRRPGARRRGRAQAPQFFDHLRCGCRRGNASQQVELRGIPALAAGFAVVVSIAAGVIHTSTRRGCSTSLGMTPTIVKRWPPTDTRRPSTSGAPPKRACQKACPRTRTFSAPFTSSSGQVHGRATARRREH